MKKFLVKLSYAVFPLWLIVVGLVFYISLYVSPRATGDIGRLGLIPFGHSYETIIRQGAIQETLFKTIEKTEDLSSIHVDILTIGDSFSQQGNFGYQNYLSQKELNVANCSRNLYSNPVQYAYNLLQENIIDSTNVKTIIIEKVEREFEGAMIDFSTEKSEIQRPIIREFHTNKKVEAIKSHEWSIIRARDYIYYMIDREKSPIYKVKLAKNLFTSNSPRYLYFYYWDIIGGLQIHPGNEEKILEVYKTISSKMKEKGIKFIFMVAVDKYDLYQNEIVENPYPKKRVMEDIDRIIGNSPHLLLSKKFLLPLIEKGEKDVFLFNDTHWSYKASRVIADEIYKKHISMF